MASESRCDSLDISYRDDLSSDHRQSFLLFSCSVEEALAELMLSASLIYITIFIPTCSSIPTIAIIILALAFFVSVHHNSCCLYIFAASTCVYTIFFSALSSLALLRQARTPCPKHEPSTTLLPFHRREHMQSRKPLSSPGMVTTHMRSPMMNCFRSPTRFQTPEMDGVLLLSMLSVLLS